MKMAVFHTEGDVSTLRLSNNTIYRIRTDYLYLYSFSHRECVSLQTE